MNLQTWTVYYNNDHGHFYSATFYWQRWAHRALQDLQRSTKMYHIVFLTHHTPPHTHSHAHTLVHRRNVMGREGEEDKIIWNLWWVWIYILGKTTVLISYDCHKFFGWQVLHTQFAFRTCHVCTHLQVTFSQFYPLMYWGWFIFILAGWSQCFCIWYSASMQSFSAVAP